MLLVQGEQLSRAAVALFCKDDIALPEFPQFSLRVARFKGTTRDEFLDNRQYAGNAFALMRRAERFLIDWLPVAGKIVPGQMARILGLPRKCFFNPTSPNPGTRG